MNQLAAVCYSSSSDDWATPDDFFQKVVSEFGEFDLDVCASESNTRARRFFNQQMNGLLQNWRGKCWMNPPYGRTIGLWMRKASEAAMSGALVVCLVPARTDTVWWHDYALRGEVRFIRGRLKFGGCPNSAPFPNALVIFRPIEVRNLI
jgi:phage N-6-adenine-methyltransferase